jgi:hypothetical protein
MSPIDTFTCRVGHNSPRRLINTSSGSRPDAGRGGPVAAWGDGALGARARRAAFPTYLRSPSDRSGGIRRARGARG